MSDEYTHAPSNTITNIDEKTPWNISDVIFSYMTMFALVLLALGSILYFNIDSNQLLFQAGMQLLLSLIALSIVYYVISKKYNIPFKKAMGINFRDLSKNFFTGFSVSFMLVISTTLVSYTFSLLGYHAPENSPYVGLSSEKLKMISTLAVFLAPTVEEVFFRGYMQPAMIKAFGPFGGIMITSIIFGLSHSQYMNYSVALVAVTVIGIVLGLTRYYTKSIMPGIFAHFFNNLFASLSLF